MSAQKATLLADLKQATADFDADKQFEIQSKLDDLRTQIVTEKLRAEQQAALAEQAFQAAQDASRAAVKAEFGDHWTDGSPLALMMSGIYSDLEAKGSPIINDPKAPEIIARQAAEKLGIKPKSEQPAPATAVTPPAVQPPSAAPQAPPRSAPQTAPPIAPGSARSSTPEPVPMPEFRNVADYNAWIEKTLGVPAL